MVVMIDRLLRSDVHHGHRLGLSKERQRIVYRAHRLARPVPGDERAPADRIESAGIRDHQNRPTRRNDDFVRAKTRLTGSLATADRGWSDRKTSQGR
jgi:hypothetical protein